MSNTRCEWFNWLLIPLAIAVGLSLSLANVTIELTILYVMCALTTIAHVHYGTGVVSITPLLCFNNTEITEISLLYSFQVRQMCKHFRIDCFRIKSHED